MIVLESYPEPYPPSDGKRPQVYLHAGQIFASSEPHEVSFVLGSCVAVLLMDTARQFGGASHYLLPFESAGALATPRFGNVAITDLIVRMLALGGRKCDLKAKIFGGASMLHAARPDATSLGSQNVHVARRRLEEEGIPIVAADVGGYRGRKVVFVTDQGQAWVKTLSGG